MGTGKITYSPPQKRIYELCQLITSFKNVFNIGPGMFYFVFIAQITEISFARKTNDIAVRMTINSVILLCKVLLIKLPEGICCRI